MGRRVRAKFQMSKGVISNQNIKKKLQGAEKRERESRVGVDVENAVSSSLAKALSS